jgi:hypothetical protein
MTAEPVATPLCGVFHANFERVLGPWLQPREWASMKIKFVFIRVHSWLEITYG